MNHKRHNKIDNDRKNILISFYKAFKAFGTALPVLFVVILVLGLFRSFLSSRMLAAVFTGELFQDTVIGSLIASISGGNAVTSYVIGGELIKQDGQPRCSDCIYRGMGYGWYHSVSC